MNDNRPPFLSDQYRLWVLLSQTRAALFRARHKRVGKYVHFNVAASLLHIWNHDGEVIMNDLAKNLFLEQHSASEIVNRLIKKGYIKKEKIKGKGNVVHLWITKKGREFCQETVQAEFIQNVMSSLTEEQQTQLRSCLNILYNRALEDLEVQITKEDF